LLKCIHVDRYSTQLKQHYERYHIMTKATANTTASEVTALDQARHEAVNSITRSYGALREYAIMLNSTFTMNWFDIEHQDQSDEAKPVLTEKKKFYGELKEGLHTNPSVVWKRVCDFGRVERFGEPEKAEANTDTDGTEGEQGESATSTNRSPTLRTVEELSTLFKFLSKQDDLPDNVAGACKDIGLILENRFKMNVTML